MQPPLHISLAPPRGPTPFAKQATTLGTARIICLDCERAANGKTDRERHVDAVT